MNATCDRCLKPSMTLTGSYFDTAMICPSCEENERSHRDFKRAQQAELEAVQRGDLNYPGIGCPPDLKINISEQE